MIKKINMLDMSIPHDCLWCKFSGIVMNAEDNIESVVCMHISTRKMQKKDRPLDREYRTYLKVMESNETCEHCIPIKTTDEKFGIMRQLGLAPEGW